MFQLPLSTAGFILLSPVVISLGLLVWGWLYEPGDSKEAVE
jgi:hypothetical protein